MLSVIFTNPLVAFILLVGLVVFVHELGHYLVGRLMSIRVEEFSIGFGPKAIGFRRGNTEYKVCWLPLGGYVRFYGADPSAKVDRIDQEQALNTAKLYKRVLVAAAGPFANLLLSLIVMIGLSWNGLPEPAPIIGVVPDGVAAKAGLQTGDRVLQINEATILSWRDLSKQIASRAGIPLDMVVQRGQNELRFQVVPEETPTMGNFGEQTKVGRIGVTLPLLSPRIVIERESILWEQGLRSGDLITEVSGEPIRYFHQLNHYSGLLNVKVLRPQDRTLFREFANPAVPLLLEFNVNTALSPEGNLAPLASLATTTDFMLADWQVLKKGDLQQGALDSWQACGLRAGDTLVAWDGQPLNHPAQLYAWYERKQPLWLAEGVSLLPLSLGVLRWMVV